MSGGTSAHNPWLIALVVTAAAFMELLDTTIVNVALPHIAGSLSSSQDESTWTLTSYLVANGIVLPISGWLSSLFGRKRFFITCILAFTACSVLCGLASNLPELVVFRVLQGLFGGGLQPSQQAILLDTFPPDQRGRAFSIVAIATVVAPVLGPSLGGWITDSYSWRWIFFVNLPVGLLAAFFVMQLIEDPPSARADPDKARHIDFPGLALIALGLGCLQVTLDRGEIDDWLASGFICTFAALSAIGIIGAIVWLSVARNPVVDLRVFRNRNFAVGSLLMFVFASILYGGAVLMPQLAQQQLGYTSLLAGLLLSPAALVTALLLPGVGRLMNIVPPRYLIMIGFLIVSAGYFIGARLAPDVNFGWLVEARIAVTIGIGFLFAPISVATTATLAKEQNSAGAALFVMARNIGGSVGISLVTALVTSRSQVHMAYLSQHLSADDQGYGASLAQRAGALISMGRTAVEAHTQAQGLLYRALLQQSAIMGYIDAFIYSGIAALLVVPLCFLLRGGVARARAGAG
jgi:MFS transporter, DHA2 family, multidrug resistance protein